MNKNIMGLVLCFSVLSGCSSISSLGGVVAGAKDVNIRSCMMKEAQEKFSANMINMANLKATATEIAATCTATNVLNVEPSMVNESLSVLKSLM